MMNRFFSPEFVRDARLGDEGLTVLMHAAQSGDSDMVRFLMPQSQLLEKNKKNWTALHFAAANGHAECARALLKEAPRQQCDQYARFFDEQFDALDLAVKNGHWECVRLLAPHIQLTDKTRVLENGLRKLPLHEAARQCRKDMLEFLAPLCDKELAPPLRESREEQAAREKKTHEFRQSNHPFVLLAEVAENASRSALECARYLVASAKGGIRRDCDEGKGGAFFMAIQAKNPRMVAFLAPFFGANARQSTPLFDGVSSMLPPVGWALRRRAKESVEALLPFCDESLLTASYSLNGFSTTAPEEALWLMETTKNSSERTRAYFADMADSILARCAELDGDLSELRKKFTILDKSVESNSNEGSLPRFRAQMEARALRTTVSNGKGVASESDALRQGAAANPAKPAIRL